LGCVRPRHNNPPASTARTRRLGRQDGGRICDNPVPSTRLEPPAPPAPPVADAVAKPLPAPSAALVAAVAAALPPAPPLPLGKVAGGQKGQTGEPAPPLPPAPPVAFAVLIGVAIRWRRRGCVPAWPTIGGWRASRCVNAGCAGCANYSDMPNRSNIQGRQNLQSYPLIAILSGKTAATSPAWLYRLSVVNYL